MSERSRKKARAESRKPKPPAIDKIAKPTPLNSMRGTFRVAQANRALADALPDVVRNRSAEKRAKTSPLSMVDPVAEAKAPVVSRTPSAPKRNVPDQPSMAERKNLKCRPADNKPKGGAGSGRSFVPWDKTCAT